MATRIALVCLIVLGVAAGPAWSQDGNADDIRRGRTLAVEYCALCHVAAPDQPSAPMLRPPAPPFASIAQRETTTADSVKTFLTTTHQGLDNPNGMPNPKLFDFEARQVTAYLLSLRKSK